MIKLKLIQMKNLNLAILGLFTIFTIGCSNDDNPAPGPPKSTIEVKLDGIEKLEGDFTYEGWLIVDGEDPVSTGRFNTIKPTMKFSALKTVVEEAKSFVLSIEPTKNDDPAPSKTKILSGDFFANSASLKIDNVIGVFNNTVTPFSGSFINKTPTDNTGGVDNMNDEKGIWFIKDASTPGLINLPTLKEGWKYEGWVVFGDTPLTTGKFVNASGVDESSPYSGNEEAPKFPGEDFVANLPAGIDGDTTGKKVVISIEPDFTTDPNSPFFIKPIGGKQGINDNTLSVELNINATINGTVTKL